ncbi:unnamed protein product [Absidia cylindrospora]
MECKYCADEPGFKKRRTLKKYTQLAHLEQHINYKHKQSTITESNTAVERAAVNSPIDNEIDNDDDIVDNSQTDDYRDTVHIDEINPFAIATEQHQIKYQTGSEPTPVTTKNVYQVKGSLSELAAKIANHTFKFCDTQAQYQDYQEWHAGDERIKCLPLTITGLRNLIRNEGSEITQSFDTVTIDIATVKGFPVDHIDDFKRATNNTPISLTYRNIHTLTEHIFSSPHLQDNMILTPSKATRNNESVIDDINTANWWWSMQYEVLNDADIVIIPLMLSSDATLVSGNGRQRAWPMYLTIGNVPKDIRFKKEHRATKALAYLPVINVRQDCANKPWMSLCKHAIFQHCMGLILAPFRSTITGKQNTKYMSGPYGKIYKCMPMLATYSADYPEQCLFTATKSWANGFGCPRCLITCSQFKKGKAEIQKRTSMNMQRYSNTRQYGSFPLSNAFWDTGFDIYDALVIDDLHKLGGIYRHLVAFVEKISRQSRGKVATVEERYKKLPPQQHHQSIVRQSPTSHVYTSLFGPRLDSTTMLPLSACLRRFLHPNLLQGTF